MTFAGAGTGSLLLHPLSPISKAEMLTKAASRARDRDQFTVPTCLILLSTSLAV
jgi:hypothetical protein